MIAGLFVLVLELCIRTEDWFKWGAPFWGEYSRNILMTNDALGIHNRPNAQFEKWRINHHGFRGKELSLKKPKGVIRIAITGASETFGLYESQDMEFASQMQKMLDAVTPNRYQVLNAASVGMTPPRIAHYFNSWIINFSPDILIFYPTPSFYLEINPVQSKIAIHNPGDNSKNLWPFLRLKRKLRTALKQFIPANFQMYIKRFLIWRAIKNHPQGWVWNHPPPSRTRLFRQHLNDLISQVQEIGVQVIISTHANRFSANLSNEDYQHLVSWRKFFPRASERCLLDMESKTNDIIRRLSQSHSVRVIDIAKLVPKSSKYFADFAHFTDKGAHIVASAFTKEILNIASP